MYMYVHFLTLPDAIFLIATVKEQAEFKQTIHTKSKSRHIKHFS